MESNTKFALQLPKQGFYSFAFAEKKEIKNIRYSSNIVENGVLTGKKTGIPDPDFVLVPDPTRKTSTRTRPIPAGTGDPHTSKADDVCGVVYKTSERTA